MEMPFDGLLLVQLGSPSSAAVRDVRSYLTSFLLDPRLVRPAPPGWPFLVKRIIAPLRSRRSARNYQDIVDDGPMPLLTHTQTFAQDVELFWSSQGLHIPVRFGFQHGSLPSVAMALEQLLALGCRRIRVVPLYPQRSEATVVAAEDCTVQAMEMLGSRLDGVQVDVVEGFCRNGFWEKAIAQTVVKRLERVQVVVFSFHGYPSKRCTEGDPYHEECEQSARSIWDLVKANVDESFALPRMVVSYQSKFGNDRWLEPSTMQLLRQLPKLGKTRILVVCPAFVADNLETLFEVDIELSEIFRRKGGQIFSRVPCLNADPMWVESFAQNVGSLPAEPLNSSTPLQWKQRWNSAKIVR